MKSLFQLALAAFCIAASVLPAQAYEYPGSKPITAVVPFAAGENVQAETVQPDGLDQAPLDCVSVGDCLNITSTPESVTFQRQM